MKKEKEQSSSEEQKAANENLLIRLNQNYGKLSKGQKRLADFITAHYDQAVSMTAARLGQQVGVSESTTVRFAMQLGYAGYPEFQRALEEMVMNRLNSVQRMQFTYGRVPQGEILETVLQSDIEKIKMTLEEVDRSAFERAADTILSARTICRHSELRAACELSGVLSPYDFPGCAPGTDKQLQRDFRADDPHHGG